MGNWVFGGLALFFAMGQAMAQQNPGRSQFPNQKRQLSTQYHGGSRQQIPATELPISIAVEVGDLRKCSVGLGKPVTLLPKSTDSFNPVVIPKAILTLPISLGKVVGWTFLSSEKRASLVSDAVFSEASNSKEMSAILSRQQLKTVSMEVGQYFKDYKVFPGNLAVGKVAYKNFARAMVANTFADLKLGCTEADLNWLSSIVLEEFEQCLAVKTTESQLEDCLGVADVTAAYKIGVLASQMLIAQTLKDQNLSDLDMAKFVKHGREYYEQCAVDRVLMKLKSDKTIETQVCVAAAMLEVTRALAKQKSKEVLLESGFTEKEALHAQSRIFDLNQKACSFSVAFGDRQLSPNAASHDLLVPYFKKGGRGSTGIKEEIFKCLNEVTTKAGSEVVGKRLVDTPEIKEHLDGLVLASMGHNRFAKDDGTPPRAIPVDEYERQYHLQQTALQEKVINEIYSPCVERLKKSLKPGEILDPTKCEDEILTSTTAIVLEHQLGSQFREMAKSLPREAHANVQKIIRDHDLCVKAHYKAVGNDFETRLDDADLVECTKLSITEFVKLKARYELPSQIREKVHNQYDFIKESPEELFPDMKEQIDRIADQCVEKTFKDVKSTKDIQTHIPQLEPNCMEALTNHTLLEITPKVAERVLYHELAKSLPPGMKAADVAGPFRKDFLKCVFGENGNGGISSNQSTELLEKSLNACVDVYVSNSVGNVAALMARDNAEKFLKSVDPKEHETDVSEVEALARRTYEECVSQSKGSIVSGTEEERALYMAHLKNCAYTAAPVAGAEVIKRWTHSADFRTVLPEIKDPTELDSFVIQGTAACKRYLREKENCVADLEAVQNSLNENARNGFPLSPSGVVLQSKLGERIIKSELANAVSGQLDALIPQSADDKFGSFKKNSIREIVSPQYLDKLLATKDGVAIVSKLKANMLADPEYDAKTDKELSSELTKLLMSDTSHEGFVDRILYAVAAPSYEKQVGEIVQGQTVPDNPWYKGGKKAGFWLGIVGSKISPEMVSYYPWVAQTPSAQKARDYLKDEVLGPMLDDGAALTPKQMEEHEEAIGELLGDAAAEATKTKEKIQNPPKPKKGRRRG